jgi:hypothetical protein
MFSFHTVNEMCTVDPGAICRVPRRSRRFPAGSSSGVETQSDNMIARYHLRQLNGTWDSEYFVLRRRVDPFVP